MKSKKSLRWIMSLTAVCLGWMGPAKAQEGAAKEPDVMHPPKLSVDLKEASLKDLAEALNSQLGGEFVRTELRSPPGEPKLNLKVQDQPFWDILLQAHKQWPQGISVPGRAVDERAGNIILSSLMSGTPQEVYVTDGVCAVPLPAGKPWTGNWELRCWIYTDPRIRLSYYMSDLRVEKAIDQDGRALSPLPALSARRQAGYSPRPMAVCSAAFAAAPGLKMIKELRGSAAVEIIESTETLKIDLTQEQKEPVASAIGKFTVQKGTDGEYTVTLAPAAGADVEETKEEPGAAKQTAGTVVDVRMIDTEGGIQPAPNIAGVKSWTLRPFTRTLTPARLEIVICLKTRETTLPVVFKDLPIPENPTPLPSRR